MKSISSSNKTDDSGQDSDHYSDQSSTLERLDDLEQGLNDDIADSIGYMDTLDDNKK